MSKSKKRLTILLSLVFIILYSVNVHNITHKKISKQEEVFKGIKVYTPEWGVVATMLDMRGQPPFAMGSKESYSRRVYSPKLPDNDIIIDVGHRGFPNREVLEQLELDIIISEQLYDLDRIMNSHQVPVEEVDFGLQTNERGKIPSWAKYTIPVRLIGKATHQTSQAEEYISKSRNRISQAGQKVRQQIGNNRKIIIVEFGDERNINITPISNPLSLAADIMGLELISLGIPNKFGWMSKPIHALYDVADDTCLIIIGPTPELFKHNITHSPIWQHSAFAKPNACVYVINPVWERGGIASMVTFAENLEHAVTTQTTNKYSYGYFIGEIATAEVAQ